METPVPMTTPGLMFFASRFPEFRISAFELQIFDTQPFFGQLAIFFGNRFATFTIWVPKVYLPFRLAFLADWVTLLA